MNDKAKIKHQIELTNALIELQISAVRAMSAFEAEHAEALSEMRFVLVSAKGHLHDFVSDMRDHCDHLQDDLALLERSEAAALQR